MGEITRFAPSPTGALHLGHAASAREGWRAARAKPGGWFWVRIEDIDGGRCRPAFTAGILEDLRWLGLGWDGEVRIQSEHLPDYQAALQRLDGEGLIYPCFCTRKEIEQELAQAQSAPHGPLGLLYPGTCKRLDPSLRAERIGRGDAYALRLDVGEAQRRVGPLRWHDAHSGWIDARPDLIAGDTILARKDTPTSYHLAVTVDDHLQGVTLVTRGQDLLESTHIHRLLQALLGYLTPAYAHHPLLCDPATGRRFAKRDAALTLQSLRAQGRSPADVWAMIDQATPS
jgi:glutamyl-Q tRNA(Asp) synthetase